MRRIFFDSVIVIAGILIFAALVFRYQAEIFEFLSGRPQYTMFVNEVALTVTVADEQEEWQQGLSGVESLEEREGKLFIFDESGRYGMWMKDMLIPIDIIWIDEYFKVVHIEEKVSPDTYPKTFYSVEPARFVLETSAYFVETYKLEVGQEVSLPAAVIPKDLRKNLQR